MHQLNVRVDRPGHALSRHLYGHLAEHLGTGVYGGLWVGHDSQIPHTRGFRNDVVEALRRIRVPNLRWPGGCFAETYHWRDGIGQNRPSRANCWTRGPESNEVGTHEFLDLCEQLGCDPYICGNMGTGSPQEMSEWLEYLTAPDNIGLGTLRAANGRTNPWEIKYWAVGNENWGCGGRMTAQQYAQEYRRFGAFCRNLTSDGLYKVACGWEDAWNNTLLADCATYIDGLSIHHYSRAGTWGRGNDPTDFTLRGHATDYAVDDWWEILRLANDIDGFLDRTRAIMDRYDPNGRIGLIVDEWGTWFEVEAGRHPGTLYQQQTIRDAVVAGHTLNLLHGHADRVWMANIAQMVNVLQAMVLTDGAQMVLTPTYHVFEMYKVHHDAIHVPVEWTEPAIAVAGVPVVSASASLNTNGTSHVSLCNLHPDAQQTLRVRLPGFNNGEVAGRLLTVETMLATNTFDGPTTIAPTDLDGAISIAGDTATVTMPPRSVAVLSFEH